MVSVGGRDGVRVRVWMAMYSRVVTWSQVTNTMATMLHLVRGRVRC